MRPRVPDPPPALPRWLAEAIGRGEDGLRELDREVVADAEAALSGADPALHAAVVSGDPVLGARFRDAVLGDRGPSAASAVAAGAEAARGVLEGYAGRMRVHQAVRGPEWRALEAWTSPAA